MAKYLRCISGELGLTVGKLYEVAIESDAAYYVEGYGHFTKEPDSLGKSYRNWFILETEGGEIMVIDGVKYHEVKREAAVGERVKVTEPFLSYGHYTRGDILTIVDKDIDGDVRFKKKTGGTFFLKAKEYVVLEPIEQATDIVSEDAALIVLQRKVNELTRQVDGLTGTVAKLAEKVTKDDRKVTFDKPEKAPLTRDEIVAKAAADVADLRKFAGTNILNGNKHSREVFWPHVDNPIDYCPIDRVRYELNSDKRTVVALIYGSDSRAIWAKGIAKAAPGDVFNEIIGKAIALRRALGLPVPTEYTDAPKPEGVRVGDVLTFPLDDSDGWYGLITYGVTSLKEGANLRVITDNADGSSAVGNAAYGGDLNNPKNKLVLYDDSARYDASGKAAEPYRSPSVGDTVRIVDSRKTNIGRAMYLSEGPAYYIAETDDSVDFPFNIAKLGETGGIWCAREAFEVMAG